MNTSDNSPVGSDSRAEVGMTARDFHQAMVEACERAGIPSNATLKDGHD